MVSTRRKHYPRVDDSNPYCFQFQALISAIQASQSIDPKLLKILYHVLLLSLSTPGCCSNDGFASDGSDVKFGQFGFKFSFNDIRDLSDILFKELDERFIQFHDASPSQAYEKCSLHLDGFPTAEELTMLLRCCMVILNFFETDQNLLFEKCKVLFSILGRICSLDLTEGMKEKSFKKSISRECSYTENGCTTSFAEDISAFLCFTECSELRLTVLSAVLEVFADELLTLRSLREYFILINSISSTNEMLFICHPSHCDMGVVLEVITAHFLSSFSSEQAFDDVLNKLFRQHAEDCRVPELSLAAGLSLLANPILLSAPKILQAHVISLVSEAIGINKTTGSQRPDHRLMECYLSAFENSVILYARNMCGLQKNDHPMGTLGSDLECFLYGRSFQQPFESYILPATRAKINHVVTNLESSWHSRLCDMHFRTESDLLSASISHIMESQDVLDEACKEETLSILNSIILRAAGDISNTSLHMKKDSSPQDLYLLASILQLMSTSLIQALWCIRHCGGCLNSLTDFSLCREYVSIVSIIYRYFSKFKVHLPIQKFLCDVMEGHPIKHTKSKLMLLHFSGLLSLCFISGLDFLLKGCIYAIMAAVNLFIFEEGNLSALNLLLGSESNPDSSELSPGKVVEVTVGQKSSEVVALKFQKIRTMYLRPNLLGKGCTRSHKTLANDSTPNGVKESVAELEEETHESCSGKIFLQCLLEGEAASSDLDDLADFIECKQGKDYSRWLKDRQKYRKLKCEKHAVISWQKKRETWKQLKRKRS